MRVLSWRGPEGGREDALSVPVGGRLGGGKSSDALFLSIPEGSKWCRSSVESRRGFLEGWNPGILTERMFVSGKVRFLEINFPSCVARNGLCNLATKPKRSDKVGQSILKAWAVHNLAGADRVCLVGWL